MSKYERNKGARIEREIVNLHKELGMRAERVPLSGATRYMDEGHDINIYVAGRNEGPFVAEVKARASGAGFTLLERWLSDHDILFLRRDRAEPLVVLPWNTWVVMLRYMCPDVDPSISTQPSSKNGRDGTTYAKPDGLRGSKGEDDEHSDAP